MDESSNRSDNESDIQDASETEDMDEKKSFGFGHIVVVLIRTVWSLSIGLVFFVIGTVLYVMLDILYPKKDYGAKMLTKLYEIGSLAWLARINFGIKVSFGVGGSDLETVVTKRKKQK
ncbi:MAG: hypothetical protein GX130_09280 [Candidatus Hydrogenedens sp.]|jgi:hypothetical protein|nr:hypothetical protein [Candidatus Hydrogenedens sp.]